jgi:integrase
MIANVAPSPAAQILQFPSLRPQVIDPDIPFTPAERITVRAWYERCVLPEIEEEQSRRSLASDRCAINRWEGTTGDPDIRDVAESKLAACKYLKLFRDGVRARGCSPASVNAYWREVKAIFADAREAGLIARVPRIGKRKKSKLLREPPKAQRPILVEGELAQLWRNCAAATYPRGGQFPAPLLWRVALVLFWTYGPRTIDVFRLRWEDVDWSERLLRFEAFKTSKLQGLPLTDTVIAHLKSIRGHSERMFPRFNTSGSVSRRGGKIKRGYRVTWRREIGGATIAPAVTFKHFRESMVTRYNTLRPDLGAWIAAHYIPGVTAQHYDLPSAEIRAAIESAPVPTCFHEIG